MGKSYKSAYAAAYAAAYLSTALPWAAGAALPALDLNFLDATVTSAGSVSAATASSVNDPTFTYTGASHKRQWNSDGVLEYAPHNLIIWSEDLTEWVAAQGSVVSSGVSDTGSGADVYILANGVTYADNLFVGVDLTRDDADWILVEHRFGGVVYAGYWVDTSTWSLGSANGTAQDGTLTENADGSYRLTFRCSGTSNSSNLTRIRSVTADGDTGTASGDGGFGATRVQVSAYPCDATYIKTEGSEVYSPRVGTNNRKPVTNLLTYPGNLDNTDAWSTVRASVSGGQTDPFGGTDAWKLIENTDGSSHGIRQTFNFVNGKTYTYSTFVAPDERGWVQLVFPAAAFPSTPSAYFNVTDGLVGTTAGIDGYGIAAVEGTNYFRVWATAIADANATSAFSTYIANADNGVSYTGDGSSGLYLYMPMLNEGGIEDCVGVKNLLDDDKDFSAWTTVRATVTSNSVTAPDGTTTADTVATDASESFDGAVRKTITYVGGQTYNFSIFGKAGDADYIFIRERATDGSSHDSYFNVNTGQTATIDGQHTATIKRYANGFFRASIVFTAGSSGSSFFEIFVSEDDNNTGSDGSGHFAYIWGAQLTKGSTLYPYVGMPQTGFVKAGYTAEASATNLHTDSEDFSAAAWGAQNTGTLNVDAIGPDGLTSATTLIDSAATGTGSVTINDVVTVATSTEYVVSVFFKADQLPYAYIALANFTTPSGAPYVHFDLAAGSVISTAAGYDSSGIIPVGNGWYLCWASFTTDASDTSGKVYYGISSNGASSTTDLDGTSSILIYGAQLETGTYPSSYIKTSGGTATRANDQLFTNDMSWYPASGEYSATIEATPIHTPSGAHPLFNIGDNENSRSFLYRSSGSRFFAVKNASGVSQANVTESSIFNDRVRSKHAVRVQTDSVNAADNGVADTADTTAEIGTTADELHIAQGYSGGANSLIDIRSLTITSTLYDDSILEAESTQDDPGTRWLVEQAA